MEWITCDSVEEEAWKRLLEFANLELTYNFIVKLHGEPENRSVKTNYRKQAEQIRACLLQAKEYFSAARHSSIITSPNHLYYGVVALNSAYMLIHSDGTKSLDFLRKDGKNKSHGLTLTTGVDKNKAKKELEILENTYVSIESNGFFKNWYETLPNVEKKYGLIERVKNNNSSTGLQVIGSESISSFIDISGKNYSIISIIKYMPDLYNDLVRYGVDVNGSRISQNALVTDDKQILKWTIHSALSHEHLLKIINVFNKRDEPNYFIWDFVDGEPSAIVSIENRYGNFENFTFPSSRVTLNNQNICYDCSGLQSEIVDAAMVTYGLSMLSRYFPDLWVSCIDSHCKSSKIIEGIVALLVKKYPIMTLSFINNQSVILSRHKPFWHKD